MHVLPGESAARILKRSLGAAPTWDQLAQLFRENPALYEQYRREATVGARDNG